MFSFLKKKLKESTNVPATVNKYHVVPKIHEERQKARDVVFTLANGEVVTYVSKSYFHGGYRSTVNLITGKFHCFVDKYLPEGSLSYVETKPYHPDPRVPHEHEGMLEVSDENGTLKLINMLHVVSIEAKPIYETDQLIKATYTDVEEISKVLE